MGDVETTETDERGGLSLALVHLSDIHFGAKHRFGPQQTTMGDRPPGDGPPPLAEALRADLAGWAVTSPAITCITGDLTETASPAEFRSAREFISELEQVRLGGEPTPIVLVPGNHDVDWTQGDPHERLRPWSQFLGDVREERISPADCLRAQVVTDHVDSHGVVIAALNSAAWVQQGKDDSKRGRIAQAQLTDLRDQLATVDPDVLDQALKVALVHHHPVLMPDLAEPGRGYDAIENSAHLLRILKQFGFHVVLHGHKHLPFTFLEASRAAQGSPSRPLLVVGGGSASSTELNAKWDPVNTYNRILVKHLPTSGETRISIETRRLVRANDEGDILLDSDWTWTTLCTEDRTFGHESTEVGSRPSEDRPFGEDEDDDTARISHYEYTRGYLPVIEVRPSLEPGQAYEAELRVVLHRPPDQPSDPPPTEVVWSAGPKHHIIRTDHEPFAALLPFYGPMLVQMDAIFADGHEARSFIYAQDSRVTVADES